MPRLTVVVDERVLAVEVPQDMLDEAAGFFQKMDRDMDCGWQMGPEFIEAPDRTQRCQVAANKLLVSLSGANETMVQLMAGYILSRLPRVSTVNIDTDGEMQNTRFEYHPASATSPDRETPAASPETVPLSKREALARAGKEVSAVYRAGRGYRFATLQPGTGEWAESALLDDEAQANEARLVAVRERYEALVAGRLN